ncbi:hypothetical protein BDFB_005587 [Asbolus verrucosus]|uniref:Uncharacterized protein n=1 Tax=Asbolus verrucosus TaxID=1661398 RepID=A0A482VGF2_ASBVE|nr:hypothetical protein BDFB_005587 [Asbolus verrucosus]
MFGLHHHQDAAGLHHHHQPRGPSLKEEPLSTTRSWMQPAVPDQNGYGTPSLFATQPTRSRVFSPFFTAA